MSNFKPLYASTDSVITKELLNEFYGKEGVKHMNNYICVQRDNQPMIIFKDKIIAVTRCADDGTALIHCHGGQVYMCDTKYTDVVKMLFK